MPLSDVYMGMKLGTIDSWIAGTTFLHSYNWNEVTTGFVYKPLIGRALSNYLINMDSYNALPDDLKLMLDSSAHLVTYTASTTFLNQNQYCLDNASAQYGMELYAWPEKDIKELTQTVVEGMYPELAAKSPGCAEIIALIKQQMTDYERL